MAGEPTVPTCDFLSRLAFRLEQPRRLRSTASWSRRTISGGPTSSTVADATSYRPSRLLNSIDQNLSPRRGLALRAFISVSGQDDCNSHRQHSEIHFPRNRPWRCWTISCRPSLDTKTRWAPSHFCKVRPHCFSRKCPVPIYLDARALTPRAIARCSPARVFNYRLFAPESLPRTCLPTEFTSERCPRVRRKPSL